MAREDDGAEEAIPFSETLKKSKGGAQRQLFVVEAMAVAGMNAMAPLLNDHFAYLHGLERDGTLFAAGPLGRADEMTWSGGGLIVLATTSIEAARTVAEADPLHAAGVRRFTIKPWLLNEGTAGMTGAGS